VRRLPAHVAGVRRRRRERRAALHHQSVPRHRVAVGEHHANGYSRLLREHRAAGADRQHGVAHRPTITPGLHGWKQHRLLLRLRVERRPELIRERGRRRNSGGCDITLQRRGRCTVVA
jgi:hypothetical protein